MCIRDRLERLRARTDAAERRAAAAEAAAARLVEPRRVSTPWRDSAAADARGPEALELRVLEVEEAYAEEMACAAEAREAAETARGKLALLEQAAEEQRQRRRHDGDEARGSLAAAQKELESLRRLSGSTATTVRRLPEPVSSRAAGGGDDGDGLDGHALSRAELWQELCLQQRCVVALEEALQTAEHRSALLERAGGPC
eukprot:scaffold49740_cov60-Phaeocystis_antarctica.AAC.1